MPVARLLRKLLGAASQAELDVMGAATQSASSAVEARRAADDARDLVARVRSDHLASVERLEGELSRLSERVEAMPAMRSQLEGFVHSLGRTLTEAAERLEAVDDRMREVESQSRSQTEILAVARGELDRQGRSVAGFENQIRTLEAAVERLVAASDRTEALARELELRRRDASRREAFGLAAAVIAVLALVVAFLR